MTRMADEAAQAGSVVATQRAANADRIAALGAQLRAAPPAAILTCARGSSDHAATFAKYLIETRLGVLTASLAPSLASVYDAGISTPGALCLAISQSGRSPDILATVAAARQAGVATVAMVNEGETPLAGIADIVIPLLAGVELSVAATKSYVASLAAIVDLVAAWGEDQALAQALADAPALLDRAWALDWSPLVDRLVDAQGLYVIGRGLGLGVAQEAALKLKETCGLHGEAFSAAELRHGPMALLGPKFPLLVFRQSDQTEEGIDDAVADAIARGADVLVAGSDARGVHCLPTLAAHPAIEPMLQIVSFYRAANALSLRRGLDPDRPPHLQKVTETI